MYYLIYLSIIPTILSARITGIVTDAINDKPLQNVNVTSEEIGTSTNKNGKFNINVSEGDKLKISHIGYETIYVKAENNMHIKMGISVIASDEILVKAGLYDEPSEEIASSIHVFNTKKIGESGADHFQTLTEQIPNLNWAGGTSRPRYFQIRGIGERSHYFGEGQPNFSVGFVIDEMDMSGLGMIGQLYDLEQIDIFRGPQSSAYGANAMAGLISLRSKDPHEEFNIGSSIIYGSDNNVGLKGFVNFKVLNHFVIRISGNYNYANGFRENRSRDLKNTNKRDESFIRYKMIFDPNEWINFSLTAIYSKLDNGYDVWAPNNNQKFITYTDDNGEDSQKTSGFSLVSNVELGEKFAIKNITSLTQTDLVHSYDSDWADSSYWADNHDVFGGWYRYFDKNEKLRHNFTQEFRAKYGTSLVGVYYKELQEYDNANGWLFNGQVNQATGKYNFRSIAAYSQIKLNISPQLIIKGNIRFEENYHKYKGTFNRYDYYNYETVSLDPISLDNKKDKMIGYRASFTHFVKINSSYFLSIARGYKSGGFNQGPFVTASSRTFGPEYVKSYELGFKSKMNTYNSKIVFFSNIRENQQVSISQQASSDDPNTFIFITDNAGKGRVWGMELDHEYYLFPSIKLNFSFGILGSYIEKFQYQIPGDEGAIEMVFGGHREAAMAPRNMVSIGLYYSISNFFIHTSTTYKDEYYYSDSHNQKSKPYCISNITIGKSFGDFNIKFWARNIFNQIYSIRGFYFGLIPPYYQDELFESYGDPMQFGFSLDFELR